MTDRHTVSSTLSADVIAYLIRKRFTQVKIARMLGVTEGYISLVKSRERSLTLDHLQRLSDKLSLPLGALLLSVAKPRKSRGNAQQKQLHALAEQIIKQTDSARAAIMDRPVSRR